ncbi:MAG: undecaprenyl/decaprenyl-phosphate alpha-N-acetylglucosaminyl 1-phosphate transferase [Candidatus Hydrogenedentes bacterium]|nr:undecaprenyl/decaprenyl-phosphate alpha-N-acetylglucosaminyl 1-phosphate transferase [Candidatus Hydrogenedentota bacterium]
MTAQFLSRYGVAMAMGCLLALVLEPLVLWWARHFGIIDKPNWRKIHTGTVARAGGVVFLPALVIALGVTLSLWPVFWRERYVGLISGALIVTLAGLWDDIYGMRPAIKLGCQFLAGAALFAFGYQMQEIGIPWVSNVVEVGPLSFLITVVGTAAIINAINMLDGLDGLAAGSVVIMCGFLLFNKIVQGAWAGGIVLVIVMGAGLGFLRYNFYPAKVFMGDTGSMFLGLVLAAETFDSVSQGTAVAALLLPLVILGIPIFDMLRTIVTRARAARHIFAADKSHLHHRLLELGLTHRQVVLFVYAMNVYMGIMATIYKHVAPEYRGLYLLSMGLFLFLAFYLVAIGNKSERSDGAP